jgi:hypothetical protein
MWYMPDALSRIDSLYHFYLKETTNILLFHKSTFIIVSELQLFPNLGAVDNSILCWSGSILGGFFTSSSGHAANRFRWTFAASSNSLGRPERMKLLPLVFLAVVGLGGHEVRGWKVMTSINGWIKSACIAENIKVFFLGGGGDPWCLSSSSALHFFQLFFLGPPPC